jgi:hypothetical protein
MTSAPRNAIQATRPRVRARLAGPEKPCEILVISRFLAYVLGVTPRTASSSQPTRLVRLARRLPQISDEWILVLVVTLCVLYLMTVMVVTVPVWFVLAYFGTIGLVSPVLLARNAFLEGHEASHDEHEHAC